MLENTTELSCDVLVIGGGGASLRAAVEAQERGAQVLVVSKARVGRTSNTYISGGVIAVAGLTGYGDSIHTYLKDTVTSGRFLNDQKLVNRMAEEARDQVPFLEEHGTDFARQGSSLSVNQLPGHSRARHVRTRRPRGRNYLFPLANAARRLGIRLRDRAFITRLHSSEGRIAGASGLTDDGDFLTISAKCVILATGGYAPVYGRTNNAQGITGDGVALAYGLGVPLMDPEFVQFYPTAMGERGSRMLFYEGLLSRGGARLRNVSGEDIITKHNLDDPMAMTRDRLARAVAHEIFHGLDVDGGVLLDFSSVEERELRAAGGMIPTRWTVGRTNLTVAPTAHFSMGGIMANEETETTIPGLFAAGEVCAGLHGANRLVGNALAEVFVMGCLAGRGAAKRAGELDMPEIPPHQIQEERDRLASNPDQPGEDVSELTRALREAMWTGAGVIRDGDSLETTLARIEELKHRSRDCDRSNIADLRKYLEFQNMLLLSDLICRAALMRTESRGSHYRNDFPEEDNVNWLRNIVVQKEEGRARFETKPVSQHLIPFG